MNVVGLKPRSVSPFEPNSTIILTPTVFAFGVFVRCTEATKL